MTNRNPVSAIQNVWFDSEQVDNTDLTLEQNYNSTIQSGIINNHIGSGVLPEVLTSNILFDSSLVSGFLDGTNVQSQAQPSDSNYGNQLEVELTSSTAAGKRKVKVGIIGLDFESNLSYETFYFSKNEKQISKKHFTRILVLLFNDFIGDSTLSLNLGGKIVIREVKSATLSRDTIMVAQNVEPNLFFRDFFTADGSSLSSFLQTALPYYNIDYLEIYTSPSTHKSLLKNDVVTQIGQKFQATTSNFQKISLLMSVENPEDISDLVWTGDLVISLYALQSTVEYYDVIPNSPIDFQPDSIPIAQLSVNYNTLQDQGVVLNEVDQPVDFIFSDGIIASGTGTVTVGNYYAITVKRSGSANKCNILLAAGTDKLDNSRITVFTGTLWVDLPDEDLWFIVYTDAAKVSDGQLYESGNGIMIEKTTIDSTTQSTVDYCMDKLSFAGNEVYRAVVTASTEKSVPIPDQRTGNPVLSRQQYVPEVQLMNTLSVANLESVTEPLMIGAIADKNIKSSDPLPILANLHGATVVGDEMFMKVITDSTDPRYDTSVTELKTRLLSGELIGSKIFPRNANPTTYYRVSDAKLYSMIVGDVNGDGLINEDDLTLLNTFTTFDQNILIGYNFSTSLPLDSVVTTTGTEPDEYTTYTNGYTATTSAFVNLYAAAFQIIRKSDGYVVAKANDGILIAHPTDQTLGYFTSATIQFNTFIGISANYKIVVDSPSVLQNYGGFEITSLDSLSDVLTIRKLVLNTESMLQIFRADVDSDFYITSNDGYLLESYINKVPLPIPPSSPYPTPTSNQYTNIGTRFEVIKLKVEEFVDRADDYSSVLSGRPSEIHPLQDIFVNDDTGFASHNFYTTPIEFKIIKQLVWLEDLVLVNSRARAVPSVFVTTSGFSINSSVEGVVGETYPTEPEFDSGRVDFYAPNNIIIGEGGELKSESGEFYKVDFDIGTIVLEIPNGLFNEEKTINIVDDFIVNYESRGLTRLGFPAMKFADNSYVESDALSKDQLRFSVSVQSFSPNTNGTDIDSIEGVIVDGKMGVYVDYETGMIKLNFTNLYQDLVMRTLSTKIQVNVYLKKGGFNNDPLFIDSTKVQNILGLISVFNSNLEEVSTSLVDLSNDVTGVLPVLNGGTGLSTVGANGTVLASNGTSLSYQFISSLANVIDSTTGATDAGKIVKTDSNGYIDPTFYYKNYVYIYGCAGIFTTTSVTDTAIGAFTYRAYDYIDYSHITDIRLEAILETDNASYAASIQLYGITTPGAIGSPLTTTSTTPAALSSSNLILLLPYGGTTETFEIRMSVASGGTATCKMARLVLKYSN